MFPSAFVPLWVALTAAAVPSVAPEPSPETGDFKLKITGYAQADGRFVVGDEGALVTNQFVVRRVRPVVQGTVAQYFDFYIVPDFGSGATVLQDAYVDVRFSPQVRVRAGKMKHPFGIERLQSGQALSFVERALPNVLVPNRDIGVQVHGELGQGLFAYALGMFNGVADGGSADADTNDGKDVTARVFLRPMRGLGLGFAVNRGSANGAFRSYTSVSQVAIYSYGTTVTATDHRTRLSPQGYFYSGPFGLLAEYVLVKEKGRKDDSGKPTVTVPFEHSAWSVTASFLVTGEDASCAGVKPKTFFVPGSGKWGALQLVARVNRLDLDDDTLSVGLADPAKSVSRATGIGVGLNWIWNNNVKYALDFEQTQFKGGAADGADRPAENSVQARLQLSF
jgi:phosphate-selective porin OprO/OprP